MTPASMVLAVVIMFVPMTLLVVFARLALHPKSDFTTPVKVLIWFAMTVLMVIVVSIFASAFFDWPLHWRHFLDESEKTSKKSASNEPAQRPLIAVVTTHEIVGHIYMRTVAPRQSGTANASPSFQEIFYEWTVKLTADRSSVASLKVDSLQENDIYRVEPEGADVQRISESPLEFKNSADESRYKHFALIVKCDDVSDLQPLVVTIRRSILLAPEESDLIKLDYVRSSTSGISQTQVQDQDTVLRQLKFQTSVITRWKYPPRTTQLLIHRPGRVPHGVLQAELDMRCKDVECQQLVASNLVGKWNRAATSENFGEKPTTRISVNVKPANKSENQPPRKPEVQINSAPNGIAIGGGVVVNPTVNNYGPQLPVVSWELLDKPLTQIAGGHPQTWISISIDKTFIDPKFAVICNRNCTASFAQMKLGHGGGVAQVDWGRIPDHSDIGAISVNNPNPMPPDARVVVCIESQDEQPVKILRVATLTVQKQ